MSAPSTAPSTAPSAGAPSPGANPEVLILGGGLAGSAAAILLARAGRAVTLVERDAGPRHKVCGEFLSHETIRYLRSLGLDPQAIGAVPIRSVRLAGPRRVTEAPLPFAALSLTRCRLDEALLQAAAAAGARVLRGQSAQSLQPAWQAFSPTQSAPTAPVAPLWRAALSGGECLQAPAVFLATGKHDLRGHPRPAGTHAGLIAFKQYFRLAPGQAAALARHVELLTYRSGYAGLQPVEGGLANLCCLVESRELRRLGGSWPLLLRSMQAHSPHLAARLLGAEPQLDRPLALSHIPYGFVRQGGAKIAPPGLWHLGDQATVIPSFTGDGMALALHTAHLAARMYLEGATSSDFQWEVGDQVGSQVGLATRVSRALLSPAPRAMALAAVTLWPGALGAMASRTRIATPLLLCSPPS